MIPSSSIAHNTLNGIRDAVINPGVPAPSIEHIAALSNAVRAAVRRSGFFPGSTTVYVCEKEMQAHTHQRERSTLDVEWWNDLREEKAFARLSYEVDGVDLGVEHGGNGHAEGIGYVDGRADAGEVYSGPQPERCRCTGGMDCSAGDDELSEELGEGAHCCE